MQLPVEQSPSVTQFPPLQDVGGVRDRTVGTVSVIDLKGSFMGSVAVHGLNDRIWTLLTQNASEFVINLGEVSDIDSSGLGGLAEAYNLVTNAGGAIKFSGAPQRVERLLQRTRLSTIFELYDSERAALASFKHAEQ